MSRIYVLLSFLSVLIERLFYKLWSLFVLFCLRLRGAKGGNALNVHTNISFRGWLCNLMLGSEVNIHKGVNIVISRGSSLIIKDKAWISYNSIIIASKGTTTIIGENTMIGGNCTIVSADHDINDKASLRESGHVVDDIIIGNNCWIGANCVITKGVKIGDGAIIGAGSIVTKDIPPYTIAFGIPAKPVKERFLNKIK